MGILNAAAKGKLKVDNSIQSGKDSIAQGWKDTRNWAGVNYQGSKEFFRSPNDFVSKRWEDAKIKAKADAMGIGTGDTVKYKDKTYTVQGASKDRSGGWILQGANNQQFAVSGKSMDNVKVVTKAIPSGPSETVERGPGALSRIGGGATMAVGAVGGALGSILSSLRNAGRSIGGRGEGGSGDSGDSEIGILILLSIIIHIFDLAMHYPRWDIGSGFQGGIGWIGVAYIMVTVIYFVINGFHFGGGPARFFSLAALSYFLPYIPKYVLTGSFATAISGLLFLFPIMTLYYMTKLPKGNFLRFIAILYLCVWAVIAVCFFAATYSADANTKQLVNNPWLGVKYVMTGAGKALSTSASSFKSSLQRAIATATGQPYEGEEESRVGIYIQNVRPLESRYNNMSDVFVEATIKAENVKEFYNVNTICYIEGVRQGIVTPTMLYDVSDGYENTIGCRLGKLKPGTYEVKVRANFEFETTSDVTYTFVNMNIRSDQFDKLGIDKTTVATYTGGPVELGLPTPAQPLLIEVDPDVNSRISTYPFGVSLRSKWPQGKVMRGLKYSLDVPSQIKLIDCSRDPIEVQEPEPGTARNKYIFEIDTQNARDVFDAVRCRMNYVDVKGLLGADLKSMHTLAARAKYEYAVEDTTTVVVEDIGY